MTTIPTGWGPQSHQPSSDQTISKTEEGQGYGLDTIGSANPKVLQRRTVTGFMTNLTARLQKEPMFAGVICSEDYPDEIIQGPMIIWSLEGRHAGIDNINKKQPYLSEEYPTEDGTIVQKFSQPISFNIAFRLLATDSFTADNMALELESFLMMNNLLIGQCGADAFYFTSETSHAQRKIQGGQRVHERTLHYFGTLNQVYKVEIARIQSIHIWNPTEKLKIQTIALTRSSTESVDLFPVLGPVVLVCIHTDDTHVSADYLNNIDFNLLIDVKRFGQKFYINWLDKGKKPASDTTYYASFVKPGNSVLETTVVSDQETNPGDNQFPPEQLRLRRAGYHGKRNAYTPRVLGQAVDPSNPTAGRTILFLNSDNVVETPGVTPSFLEAVTRATFQVASVLDPVHFGLQPGTAFSPAQS